MKKIAITALALVAIFLLFTWFRGEEITNFPSANSGVVAFGDSLTYGVGSAQGGGFVSMLSTELSIPITNLSMSGDTTADALKRVGDVAKRKPAITILLLGGNDFLLRVTEKETFDNLRKIIEAIHASGSAVILVGLGSQLESLSDEYNTAYVPDILDGIYGNSKLMSDSLHPNDAGYKIMAERIKPVLQKLLLK